MKNNSNWLWGCVGFALALTLLLFGTFRESFTGDKSPRLKPSVSAPVNPAPDPVTSNPVTPNPVKYPEKGDVLAGVEIPVIDDPFPELDPVVEAEPKASKPKVSKPKAAPTSVDYAPILAERQRKMPRWLYMDWRTSIVDLLKLTFLPNHRSEREIMADHLGYDGPQGQYEKNVWLHRQMRKGFEKGEIPLGDEKTKTNDWK